MKFSSMKAVIIFVTLISSQSIVGRTPTSSRPIPTPHYGSMPLYCLAGHNINRIHLSVTNRGTIGNRWSSSGRNDCFTGQRAPNFEYPRGLGISYLFGAAIWVGAIVGNDTLVSVGETGWINNPELHPGTVASAEMQFRSTIDQRQLEAIGAISEQDYIAVYADTCLDCPGMVRDSIDDRMHKPINIQITQRSMGWRAALAEDFILIEYTLKNIGNRILKEVYVGLLVDGDVHDAGNTSHGPLDDFSGFQRDAPATYLPANCPAKDSLNIAYIIDNDGDVMDFSPFRPAPHVAGLRFIDTPPEATVLSYNWWYSNQEVSMDFGPQGRATLRELGAGRTGTPTGDRNKYHFLSNGEIDYDQIFTSSITDNDSKWVFPNQTVAEEVSLGVDTRHLLSTGPFDLTRSQEAKVVVAFVAGELIHADPTNFNLNLNSDYKPAQYLDKLDFTDFDVNARWAGWVYDNPGVDTDSDGYSGEFRVCENDTNWHKGDGVADLRADIAPEAPLFWVEPKPEGLHVRWNGRGSEETIDAFTRRIDFEGYRAYLSRNTRVSGFALIGSYDKENFHRMVWDEANFEFRMTWPVQTLEEAVCFYAPGGCDDSMWKPEDFTVGNTYLLPGTDSLFYFVKAGINASTFGEDTPFLKRFPNAPLPPANWTTDSVPSNRINEYLTDDNFFKYFEYEFTINNLLPGIEYWVSINSFDIATKREEATSLETKILGQAQKGIPLASESCCSNISGNVDCDPNSIVDITDLTVLIDHLFISFSPLCCIEAANVDGDVSGVVDITDLTFLIDHLFISFVATAICQ